MKKGCFIQLVIIVTILTAIVVYIVKNHLNEFILQPGKKALSGIMMNEFDEKLAFVTASPEKDSFKVFLNNYIISGMHEGKEITSQKIQTLLDSLSYMLSDSLIDSNDFIEIKKIARSIK